MIDKLQGMEFDRAYKSDEPLVGVFVPSHPSGRFIAKTSEGSDFVGHELFICGITADDLEQIEAGNKEPLDNYLKPGEAGAFVVNREVDFIDVTETDTHRIITGFRLGDIITELSPTS